MYIYVSIIDVHVTLSFRRLRLADLPTADAALRAALEQWAPQLAEQAHRYVAALSPLRPLVAIGGGVGRLLLAPTRPSPLRGLHRGGAQLAATVLGEAAALLYTHIYI